MIRKYFSTFFLLLSIIFLFYTFYKSEIYWNGEIRYYYYKYYIFSILLFLLSLISYLLDEKIKIYLSIFFFSIIFALYCFEGYLTIKEIQKKLLKNGLIDFKEQTYKEKTGNEYDKRSKSKVYNDLKDEFNDIVVPITPKYFLYENVDDFFPLSNISNSKTVYCNENGYYQIYNTDRYGFNNPDSEWDNEVIEFLIIGDSFGEGACVNSPNDIASILRRLTNKAIINLSIGGNGPLIEYATLREYFPNNVKNILWFYYEGNDLTDLDRELKNKVLHKYLTNLSFSQNLINNQKKVDEIKKLFLKREIANIKKDKEKLSFKVLQFFKIYKTRVSIFKKNETKSKIDELRNILELSMRFAKKNDAKIYFIYLPEYSRYNSKYKQNEYKDIKIIVDDLGIKFIDIHKLVFEKEKDPLNLFPFGLPGHYNKDGYEKISKSVYKFID